MYRETGPIRIDHLAHVFGAGGVGGAEMDGWREGWSVGGAEMDGWMEGVWVGRRWMDGWRECGAWMDGWKDGWRGEGVSFGRRRRRSRGRRTCVAAESYNREPMGREGAGA